VEGCDGSAGDSLSSGNANWMIVNVWPTRLENFLELVAKPNILEDIA
jgi:hypothetical protein